LLMLVRGGRLGCIMVSFVPRQPVECVASLSNLVVVSKLDGLSAELQSLLASSSKLIGTHDGGFHCDEALACAMLKMLPEFEKSAIVRTRDPALLEKCDIVVDVGAVYNHEKRLYDHHQREFTGVMDELGHKTKLSSAGLVYRHYGKDVIARIVTEEAARGQGEQCGSPPDLDALYRKLYKSFIEHIDGIDNGIESFDKGARNYEVSSTLSGRVGSLNPRWNEPSGDDVRNGRFAAAVQLAGREFADAAESLASSWWPARALVKSALEGAAAVDPSRRIIVFTQSCPWSSHLFELEAEMAAAGDSAVLGAALYVLYGDTSGAWRIQAVPVQEDSFTSRRKLPEAWRGTRGEELDKATGIDGGVFVHAGGFIGGHKTFEGALAMAKKAISD